MSSQADISALAGQVFVIFVSFDPVSLHILDSIQISDRSTPKILQWVKNRKILSYFDRFLFTPVFIGASTVCRRDSNATHIEKV